MTKTLIQASKVCMSNYEVSAYNEPPPSFGTTDVRMVVGDIIKNLLSNMSTGIGKANRIDLPAITNTQVEQTALSMPAQSYPSSTKASKTVRNVSTKSSASAAYNNMPSNELFERRRGNSQFTYAQAVSSSSSERETIDQPETNDPQSSDNGIVSELPVMVKRKVTKELKENRWWFSHQSPEGAVWTNGTLTTTVTKHPTVNQGLAESIIDKAQKNPGPEKREETQLEIALGELDKLKKDSGIKELLKKYLKSKGYSPPKRKTDGPEFWRLGEDTLQIPNSINKQQAIEFLKSILE